MLALLALRAGMVQRYYNKNIVHAYYIYVAYNRNNILVLVILLLLTLEIVMKRTNSRDSIMSIARFATIPTREVIKNAQFIHSLY